MSADVLEYALRLGDDALVNAHRLGEWAARAPELEEDVALANIALDELGQARLLLSYAGELEGAGRDEDALAYRRDEREFRNCQLVELVRDDFAAVVAVLLTFSAYQHLLYERLTGSADERLAAIAGKAVKETAYHLDHAAHWTLRLGDGTEESHRRLGGALEACWPYTFELFEVDELTARLAAAGIGVDPAGLREVWLSTVDELVTAATLALPTGDTWRPTGGRSGVHTEAMGYLLAEAQHLHRSFPGAQW